MNRNELEARLNKALVGKSAYNMYKLCDLVRELATSWFDDKQGVIGTRLNAYTIALTYKNRTIVWFTIKRKKDNNLGWVVKEVIIDDDNFVDTDRAIGEIKLRFKNENASENWRWELWGIKLTDLTDLLTIIKQHYPNKTLSELKSMVEHLNDMFWNVDEELESEEK